MVKSIPCAMEALCGQAGSSVCAARVRSITGITMSARSPTRLNAANILRASPCKEKDSAQQVIGYGYEQDILWQISRYCDPQSGPSEYGARTGASTRRTRER